MNSIDKAKEWQGSFFDEETRNTVNTWIETDSPELEESFYKDLEFGTGGMRGIMGVGTNRVNKYTIGKATLGLSRYIHTQVIDKQASVAIAFDSRNNSSYFAEIAAKVLAANGIKAYLFSELRPTPLLSYAVRQLSCDAGIVITASHNPKEYNGYKVYWNDGGQLVSPQDKGVMDKVNQVRSFDEINFDGPEHLIERIDRVIDEPYTKEVLDLVKSVSDKSDKSMGVVFTSLHGTGITMVPPILKELGFSSVYSVPAQEIPDGNFPTVESPNPEERSALTMAIELAKSKDADLVLGTDPDADRVGLAVKNTQGEWIVLNGNQAGSILVHYFLEKLDPLESKDAFVCKTIVTTELIASIAKHYHVDCIDTLTGFKYIAQVIKALEGKKRFICGGEESFGYLAGDFVRDKDAVISSVLFTQIAAECKANNSTLYDYLLDIYKKHGLYKERLVSLTKKGKAGQEEIHTLIENYRNRTPKELAGEQIESFTDYKSGRIHHFIKNTVEKIDLESSNVLQFKTMEGSLITVRPSGTEPKIKYYFSVNEALNDAIEPLLEKAEQHLDRLEKAFV